MVVLGSNCFLFTFLLQVYISYVNSERLNDICSIPSESCGPVPPVLPESFTLKATKVDILGKEFDWMEEYFDANNERAKVVLLRDGNEMNLIFDFRAQEVASYTIFRPGGSASIDDFSSELGCKVQRISDSLLNYVLRYRKRYGNSEQTRMYSSNEVLNYGGQHIFAYVKDGNSTDEARGLPTYAFKGCVFDEDDDRTMESIYRWAEKDRVVSASGMEKVPVKIENKGKINLPKTDVTPGGFQDFNEVYDVVWFDDNANFPESIFQIPPRMQCSYTAKRKNREKPKFPSYFSTRMEILSMVEDWQGRTGKVTYDWYEEIWYDHGQSLVRLDFVPTDAMGKDAKEAFGENPISAVYDFNTGVVHYTEKTFGKCIMKKIPLNDFLVEKGTENQDSPSLAETSELMGLNAPTITYKGKYTVRDMETIAWAGTYNRTQPGGKSVDVYREFYVTDIEWHADYDDQEYFNIPIRDTSIILTNEDGQDAYHITEVNFFKFKTEQPHLSVYDISGCISSYQRKFFYFELEGKNKDQISHHHEGFLDALRQAIMTVADVGTPIRVQELEALYVTSKNVYQVTFSLLDVPSLTADISLPKKGVDLTTAASNLKANFNEQGTPLIVNFKYKTEQVTVTALRNSLKEMQAMREAFINLYSPSFKSEPETFPREVVPVVTSYLGQQIMYAPVKEKQQPTGYSSGSLAGLAISMLIIGTVVGIVAMVFYRKKKLQRESDRISLT